jgi:ornithine cyclodeaminase/alanine dehydrogenase-like protein (mu-crystallin family)
MHTVDAAELRGRLSMPAAIDVLERAFRDGDPAAGPVRSRLDTDGGQLLVMPATGPAGVGVKLVTVTPANPGRGLPFVSAVYVLFAPGTQVPETVFDGASLTALRTGAVSGLATRFLARGDATHLVLFGAGVQARAHLEAMMAVRPIDRVTIVARSREPAEALLNEVRERGIAGSIGDASAVREADIVCTCTTSDTPLFAGDDLADGAHLNAVGAYRPDAREVDTATVRRAKVVVETREAAMEEAGDLLIPIQEDAIGPDHVVAELADVVRGRSVRRSPHDVTMFESVGLAFEDLAVARAAADAR